jgi:hypothetical protein
MRLKQVNKAKAKYRDELLALRAEREEIAIEADGVRAKHEERVASVKVIYLGSTDVFEADKKQAANDLNTDLHDIEIAVQRGRAAQKAAGDDEPGELGLEARLQEMTDRVSSAGGRQGLLERTKRYNAYLEAAVGAL